MALHKLEHMGLVLQEADVAQLVDLVIADGLRAEQTGEVLQVRLGRRHDGHARTGEGDLGRRSKFIDHVGVPGLAAQREHVTEGNELAVDLVQAVGVVPHQGKVRRGGAQGGQPVNDGVGIDDTLRIGVFRHAPDALDGRVAHGGLDGVHVRAVRRHGNGDKLHAERLRHAEMAVIARCGAQEADDGLLRPRARRVQQAMRPGLGDEVIHEVQAGTAADEDLRGRHAQQLGKQALGRGNAGQLAIVAHVERAVEAVLRRLQHGQNAADHVKLRAARLAAGHVQGELLGLPGLVLLLQRGIFRAALRTGVVCIGLHDVTSKKYFGLPPSYRAAGGMSIAFPHSLHEKNRFFDGGRKLCELFAAQLAKQPDICYDKSEFA